MRLVPSRETVVKVATKSKDFIDRVAHFAISKNPEEYFFRKKIFQLVPEASRQQHTYITGNSGSGKSELIKGFVYGYLKKAQTNKTGLRKHIIIMDPHGDLAKEVRDLDILNSENLVYIDPFYKEDHIPIINPFYLPDEEKTQSNIDRMTQELVRGFENIMSDKNLSSSMKALLMPCIATLLRLEGSSLLDLQDLMDVDNPPEDLIEAGKMSDNKAHKRFFERGYNKKTYNRTKNSLYLKIQNLLNSSIFSEMIIGQNTMYLEKILNERPGKVIIFNFAKGRLGPESSQALGQFTLALIRSVALKRDIIKKRERIPIHFFIDEFPNYMGDEILEGVAELRKYRVYFWLISQILGQGMSSKDKNLVLSNTKVKIVGENFNKIIQQIAKEADIDLKKMKKLKTGKFVIKIGTDNEFVLDMPSYLVGEKHKKNKTEMESIKHQQLREYYKKIE